MKTPYQILGVDPNADDETIKKAHRALVKKYHPDKYTDDDLREIAEEKMKEVNAAYEEIQKMRAGQSDRDGTGNDSSYYAGAEGASPVYSRIRADLNAGRLDSAEVTLNGIPEKERGAEWYYLTGILTEKRGYHMDAQKFFDTACRMDPYNREYAAAREWLRNHNRQAYNTAYGPANRSGCSACDFCTGLMVADCCCECLGGDLIRCC